jgi:predicted O-methyltransferase YrrM
MNQAGFAPIVAQPRRWHVLENFMREQNYRTFVEVGCREGRTTGHILKTVPDSRVIAIDPWIANPAPKNGDSTREDYEKWDFAEIKQKFWENVGDSRKRCAMYQCTSEQAHDKVFVSGVDFGPPVEQADIVFIDALHDYESVKSDIRMWWPRVRIGGMLAGHDFNHQWPGVERAVAESFNLMQIGIASDSVWFIVKTHEDQLRASHAHPEKAP